MTLGGREGNTFKILVFFFLFSFFFALLSPPLFLFSCARKEVGREWWML
jgi:hypothetical protein